MKHIHSMMIESLRAEGFGAQDIRSLIQGSEDAERLNATIEHAARGIMAGILYSRNSVDAEGAVRMADKLWKETQDGR